MNKLNLVSILSRAGVEIIGETRRGWLSCRCPLAPWLHSRGEDRKPSFFAKINDTGISAFNCYSCKSHGRVGSLIRRIEYYTGKRLATLAMEAEIADIPEDFGSFDVHEHEHPEENPVIDEALFLGTIYPKVTASREAMRYLRGRGIGAKAVEAANLHYDPEAKRILFPIYDGDGSLRGLSGRSILTNATLKVKDYNFKKTLQVLGEHLCRKGRADLPLFVAEGLFGYLSLLNIDAREHCDPVALLGSSLSETQKEILLSFGKPIIFCPDDDEAGDLLMEAARPLAKEVPTMVALYPPGREDVDLITEADLVKMLTVDNQFLT